MAIKRKIRRMPSLPLVKWSSSLRRIRHLFAIEIVLPGGTCIHAEMECARLHVSQTRLDFTQGSVFSGQSAAPQPAVYRALYK